MVGLLKSDTEAMRTIAQNWIKQTCADEDPDTIIEAIECSEKEDELEVLIELLEEQAANSVPAAKRQKTAH